MIIQNFTVTPSAPADGVSSNVATVVVTDGASTFLPGVGVSFTVSGSASLANTQQQITVKTDALGTALVAITDKVAETVIVTATLVDELTQTQSKTTDFVSGGTGVVDKIDILPTVDGSKADGQEQNQVILQTLGGTAGVANTKVSVSLSNGAHFVNGQSTADVTTGDAGTATLGFTNTNIGSTTFTAYIPTNIAISNKVDTNFVNPTPEVNVVMETVSNNAEANGKAANTVLATVLDRTTQAPVSGMKVVFTTTGSATFEGYSVVDSDSNGQAFASLVDKVEETVSVTATVGSTSSTTSLVFEAAGSALPLRIVRIFNHNKEFDSVKGITSAWHGAVFTIDAAGGTGNYTWEVTQGSDILSITDSSSNSATFHFISPASAPAEREYEITLSDGKRTVVRKFAVTTFFSEFGRWQLYGTDDDKYPSVEKLLQIYNEWGNMRAYDGWIDNINGTHYWTNDQSVLVADAVDMSNGSVDGITYNWRCGYAS